MCTFNPPTPADSKGSGPEKRGQETAQEQDASKEQEEARGKRQEKEAERTRSKRQEKNKEKETREEENTKE